MKLRFKELQWTSRVLHTHKDRGKSILESNDGIGQTSFEIETVVENNTTIFRLFEHSLFSFTKRKDFHDLASAKNQAQVWANGNRLTFIRNILDLNETQEG